MDSHLGSYPQSSTVKTSEKLSISDISRAQCGNDVTGERQAAALASFDFGMSWKDPGDFEVAAQVTLWFKRCKT
jgi:hypothetical protein